MSNKTTYTKITAKIVIVTLFLTLSLSYIYAEYMKKDAISTLAKIDAKKTSMLVFESLYSAMQRGWSKDDLQEIISRLNNVDKDMRVNVYRSKIVAELYGEIEKDKKARTTIKTLKDAMNGVESLNITNTDYINYHYPVVAKNACLECHTNARKNDILGVIEVSYPVNELKVSLNEMINFFIIFIAAFSIVIFISIYIELDKYLIKPIRNFANSIKIITTSQDVTKRIEFNNDIEEIDSIKDIFNSMLDSIEHQFYFDSLTQLQNRKKLTEVLENSSNSFLMIINIDSFQEINDLYGEEAGDTTLKEFSNFLKECMPISGSLFRLHADEFAYLCKSSIDLDDFINSAAYISEKISKKSFKIDHKSEVNISATIGLSYGSDTLLANADTALVVAKKNKKDYLLYEDSMAMAKEYEKNFNWTKRLKQAINEDKIVPLFQPIVNTKTKQIIKYEALIRMIDDNGDYISPIHFLDLAKKNKLYHQLTMIMIEKTFQKFLNSKYKVSINISVEDILNKEIHSFIIQKLEDTKIGDRIVFEIIESEGIENFKEVLEFITEVKIYGAKISIDDFGTGYSNFDYLMKLNVDYIKIDGSMIKNIDTNIDSQIITQTIVSFAKKMNIQTVAEFVHSKNVFEKVVELDVDFAQGYYFGEPSELIE